MGKIKYKRTNPHIDYWHELKARYIAYGILEYGQQNKLAKWLGCAAMHVNSWFHPKGTRLGEPTYGYGKKLEEYLATIPFEPFKFSNGLTMPEIKKRNEKARLNRTRKSK